MVDIAVNQAQREARMHGLKKHGRVAGKASDRDRAAQPAGSRRSFSLLVLLSVAQFMVILDATVVNVALPSIARSLSFGAGGLQWVVTAYVLASGGLVMVGGPAADLVGTRPIFLAPPAAFTPASPRTRPTPT